MNTDYNDLEDAIINEEKTELRLKKLETGLATIRQNCATNGDQIMQIEANCEHHRKTSQNVLNELFELKEQFKEMQKNLADLAIVKSVVEGINLMLSKRTSILPNGAKTGIKDVNWVKIMQYIALVLAMGASAYFGGGTLPPVQ